MPDLAHTSVCEKREARPIKRLPETFARIRQYQLPVIGLLPCGSLAQLIFEGE